jgi:hypothetical protein
MARRHCIHCDKQADRRGLCGSHYQAAWRRVKEGRITWATLEAASLCLPSRRYRSEFGQQLDALAEEMST